MTAKSFREIGDVVDPGLSRGRLAGGEAGDRNQRYNGVRQIANPSEHPHLFGSCDQLGEKPGVRDVSGDPRPRLAVPTSVSAGTATRADRKSTRLNSSH